MTYRNPRFSMHHALRDSAIADWNSSGFEVGFEQSRLRDDHLVLLARWTDATGNVWVSLDRGPDFASEPVLDRWLVPAGHSLSGLAVTVLESATPITSAGQGTIVDEHTPPDAGLIDRDSWTAGPLTQRYAALNVVATGVAPELGEWWLTQTRTTVRGPVFSWQDTVEATQVEQELRSGQVQRLEVGQARRTFVFEYQAMEGADLQLLLDLREESNNGLFPIYFDPPDTADQAVLVDLIDGVPLQQDYPAPNSGNVSYSVRLRMVEHTG